MAKVTDTFIVNLALDPDLEQRLRQIIREEIDADQALRCARSAEELKSQRWAIALDRLVKDAMREGRFPKTSGSDDSHG